VTPNRKKQWVEALLEKREPLERAIEMPLGKMLGCGHWGCVFESTAPWVVKLSIDPTEGPIWSKIAGLVRDEQWGDRGTAEVKSITRIAPDLEVGGKKRKVWAIVREGIEPVFKNYTAKELYGKGRGTELLTSSFTEEVLDYSGPENPTRLQQALPKQVDFSAGIDALLDYKTLATLWHLMNMSRLGPVQRNHKHILQSRYGLYTKEEVTERTERVFDHFRGPHMGPLGESLHMLSTYGIFLRDVHLMNIGWHVSRGDDDWTYVVIFDPGHTPTGKAEIETVLLENGREAL
jgi:hypothetical protein